MFIIARWLLFFTAWISWIGFFPGAQPARTQNPVNITRTGPTCPSSGCAGGQMLDFTVDFTLSTYDSAKDPNVQVCFYVPDNLPWKNTYINVKDVDITGSTSKATYLHGSTTNCTAAPPDFSLLSGVAAKLPAGITADMLPFLMRLPANATKTDVLIVRILEQNSANEWTPLDGSSAIDLQPVAAGNNVYVANDATGCGANSPCFVNTNFDGADGFGTGLKDAIDSAVLPGTVNILGNTAIKSNPVKVDRALTLTGINNASLTYTSQDTTACDSNKPMLNITAGAAVTNLVINDGDCGKDPSADRKLITVDQASSSTVRIESNDLTGGQDAISILPTNQGNVTVRFNEIKSNSGYGLIVQSGNANPWKLILIANNIMNNQVGAQVECNGRVSPTNGSVDHNFWGVGKLPSLVTAHCNVTNDNDKKRLGAAILHNTGNPGVSAQLVNVTKKKEYSFNQKIGVQHPTTGASDFFLYIINHGFYNIPFTAGQSGNVSPCSSFWDVFMDDSGGAAPPQNLSLYFKYDNSTGCPSLIESSAYCGQNDPRFFPLWWYDPTAASWKRTDQTPAGQSTVCMPDTDEILLSLTGGGSPSISDLQYVPLVVGIPSQPTAVKIAESRLDQPGWPWPAAAGTGLCLAASLALVLLRRNEKRGTHAK